MPGTPPFSPNFTIPRYSDADPATFSEQVNAITDTLDEKAANLVQGQGFLTGDLIWSIASTRAGALPANGASIAIGTYTALDAEMEAQGYPWGQADDAHYYMPNIEGRTVIGSGTGVGLTARTLGQLVGAETVGLTGAQNGLHDHGGVTGTGTTGGGTTGGQSGLPGGQYAYLNSFDSIISAGVAGGTADTVPRSATYGDNNWGGTEPSHDHSVPGLSVPNLGIAEDGSGTPHANMQPSVVMNPFIKT